MAFKLRGDNETKLCCPCDMRSKCKSCICSQNPPCENCQNPNCQFKKESTPRNVKKSPDPSPSGTPSEDVDSLRWDQLWETSDKYGHRVSKEFRFLADLGTAGYGDVIKVRNRLDEKVYAVKRIQLNPKNKRYKKLIREVKLLSRLNHENVVRYFNSWEEKTDEPAHDDSASVSACSQPTDNLTDNSGSQPTDESNSGWTTEEDKIDYEELMRTFKQPEDGENGNHGEESAVYLSYLYIQMEYCEKSNLRYCIDAGLYKDMNRVWKLFREIIEGLDYIHEQGVIHRDLKPENIFLDSNEQVKIGDFGLSTQFNKIIRSETTEHNLDLTSLSLSESSLDTSDGKGKQMTGWLGTKLYLSPEMKTEARQIKYTQKVDLYSLGIIFFEMCYKPISIKNETERVKILENVGLPEVRFPEDFDQDELKRQTYIIKWLLNHDPTQRASTKELLLSEHLPPRQVEEEELDEVLRSTIADPRSKAYRRMLSELFSQNVNAADDLLFDSEIYEKFTTKFPLVQEMVQEMMVKIFQHHGAVRLTTPLLMPKCDLYTKTAPYARFIDHCGHIVSLPFDLRIPFVHYVARHNCSSVKRFCIDKVFREKKVYGQHPRELTECAFDIITPNLGSFFPDAEVVLLVQEIISEFPVLQQRKYYIKINHMLILHAILQHCGVTGDKVTDVLHILSGVKLDSQYKTISKSLTSLGLTDQSVSSLLGVLEMKGTYDKVASYLRCITETRGEAASKAKQGLDELDVILSNLDTLGLKLPVTVSLGFVFNTLQYSGMIFQVMVNSKKKHHSPDILATGGCYDKLIEKFRSLLAHPTTESSIHGVGVSIAFEKIVLAMLEHKELNSLSSYDILVCTIGHKPMLKERMLILRDLWVAGLRADIYLEAMQTQEEIQEFCRCNGIPYMVILKDGDTGAKVRMIEKDRITEKKLPTNAQVVDFLQQKLQASSKQEQSDSAQGVPSKTVGVVSPSDNYSTNYSNNILINFNFVIENGKLASKTRYRYESQILAKVSSTLSWLPKKSIDVIAVELSAPVLKCVVAFLELDGTEKEYEDSISAVIEKQQRHTSKKYINKICDQIFELKFNRKCNYIVLYGLKDDSLKLLT